MALSLPKECHQFKEKRKKKSKRKLIRRLLKKKLMLNNAPLLKVPLVRPLLRAVKKPKNNKLLKLLARMRKSRRKPKTPIPKRMRRVLKLK